MSEQIKNVYRQRWGNRLIACGLAFIIAALGLASYNIWDARRAYKASREIVEELDHQMEDQTSSDAWDPNNGMPTIRIDGYEYIGILEIPSCDLRLPVMADWDYTRLKISPCRFSGSYYTGDLVICGHNYARHFSQIKWIDIGEDVRFTNVLGQTFSYKVSNRETLQPTSVEKMVENSNNSTESVEEWDLTLFTCNTGGQTRCAVRCQSVQE